MPMPKSATKVTETQKNCEEGDLFMSGRSRETKVFTMLAISMTALALVLLALGSNPPQAGAFCLSDYNRLTGVDTMIGTAGDANAGNWQDIEVELLYKNSSDMVSDKPLNDLIESARRSYHFIIYGGFADYDGRIEPTARWQNRDSVADAWETISICVVNPRKGSSPSQQQRQRAEALVQALLRECAIKASDVCYPEGFFIYSSGF